MANREMADCEMADCEMADCEMVGMAKLINAPGRGWGRVPAGWGPATRMPRGGDAAASSNVLPKLAAGAGQASSLPMPRTGALPRSYGSCK